MKNSKNHWLVLLLTASLLAPSLFGCGGAETDTAAGENAPAGEEITETARIYVDDIADDVDMNGANSCGGQKTMNLQKNRTVKWSTTPCMTVICL